MCHNMKLLPLPSFWWFMAYGNEEVTRHGCLNVAKGIHRGIETDIVQIETA